MPTLSAVLAAIPSLPRPVLATLTARMIDRMDEMDGDPDIEANGDETDGSRGEDEFRDYRGYPGAWSGAGCPVGDPDACVAGDDGCGLRVVNGRRHWGADGDDAAF